MARIRTIKPEFCSSASVGKLSREARLFFLILLTEADDAGRIMWLPKKLCGVLYPLDDDVDARMLDLWAQECHKAEMLSFYEVDGTRYAQVVNFAKHQVINRPTESKLPPQPENEDSRRTHGGLTEDSLPARKEREQGTGNRKGNRETREGAQEEQSIVPFEDPWYDGFDVDPLAREFMQALMAVPKFAKYPPPCAEVYTMLAALREFADDKMIRYEFDGWKGYNRENPKKGGEKDGVAGFRNWCSKKQAAWAVLKTQKIRSGGENLVEKATRIASEAMFQGEVSYDWKR